MRSNPKQKGCEGGLRAYDPEKKREVGGGRLSHQKPLLSSHHGAFVLFVTSSFRTGVLLVRISRKVGSPPRTQATQGGTSRRHPVFSSRFSQGKLEGGIR